MFLTARLFGILTYVVLLFWVCLSLKSTSSIKKINIFLFLYLCALLLMAFLFVPPISADLYRLAYISSLYAEIPFDSFLQIICDSQIPGADFYLYLIGYLKNYHFLPAISVLIDFSLLFSILNCELKRSKTKGSFISSSLFLFMSSSVFMTSISGTRNMIAYCIIVWCVYREFVLNKNFILHLPFYLIAASFHHMGQVMLIYRVIFFLFEKNNIANYIFKILMGMSLIVIIIKYAPNFIAGILNKFDAYSGSFQKGEEYFFIWGAIISVVQYFLCIYIVFLFYKFKEYFKYQADYINLTNIIHFLIPLLIIAFLSSFFSYVTYGRILLFINIFLLPTIVMLLKTLPQKRQKNIQIKLLFISFIILIITCTRGDLCCLKFFESL